MVVSRHSHNEYTIMNEIVDNEKISQRELSKKIGLSVGTINILINKMTKEGMIKMEKVTQKQVVYMLTPAGIIEKAKKTMSYLKAHYNAIYEVKEKIKILLSELTQEYDEIFILESNDELGKVVSVAVAEYLMEYNSTNIKLICKICKICNLDINNSILIHLNNDEQLHNEILDKNNIKIINLLERL